MTIKQLTATIGEFLLKQFRAELLRQGHSLTGKLINSIEYKIVGRLDSISLDFYFEKYGIFVNTGVKASRIPYTPGKRGKGSGKKSKFIAGLIRYVKLRMRLSRKHAERVAFAIANSMKKEGMPTKKSKRFSSAKDKRRTGFIDAILSESEERLQNYIDKWVETNVELLISNFVKQAA